MTADDTDAAPAPQGHESALLRAEALADGGYHGDALSLARSFLCLNIGHSGALALIDRLENSGAVAHGEWCPGSVVAGRWRVLDRESGGMGQVYFVRDLEWKTDLAVKTIRPQRDPITAELARRLFLRESRLWLDLAAHPNIVTAHYVLNHGNALRLFMEYVAGENLAQLLQTRTVLPFRDALDLALQLTSGISHAHAHGLIHRDLKPANCLHRAGHLWITDFGLAGTLSDDRGSPLHGRSRVGTPMYMAPEQWTSTAETSTATDVYALGLILFELFGGVHPFALDANNRRRYGDHFDGQLRRLLLAESLGTGIELPLLELLHTTVMPLGLQEFVQGAPRTLARLIADCLAKDPTARPAIDVVHATLERIRIAAGGPMEQRKMPTLADVDASESNRACSYIVMDDEPRAVEVLDGFLARQPDATFAWINRAMIAVNAGERSHASIDVEWTVRIQNRPPQIGHSRILDDLASGLAPWVIPRACNVAAFSADKRFLAGVETAGASSVPWLLDRSTGRLSSLLPFEGEILGLAFDHATNLHAALNDEIGTILTIRHGEPSRRSIGRILGVGAHGQCIVSRTPGTVLAVDPTDGRTLASWTVPTLPGRSMYAIGRDNVHLLVVDESVGRPMLRIFRIGDGQPTTLTMRGP